VIAETRSSVSAAVKQRKATSLTITAFQPRS
jgi:hypothetical protein